MLEILTTSETMIVLQPKHSQLGIKQSNIDLIVNDKGLLAVPFRYEKSNLENLVMGMQLHYETIEYQQYRGNHYHYPEFAGEEFYLLRGHAVLITSNISQNLIELYLLKAGITYFIPAFIAHKVINVGHKINNRDKVELLISKHYNYELKSLQKPYVINSDGLDREIDQLIAQHLGEMNIE